MSREGSPEISSAKSLKSDVPNFQACVFKPEPGYVPTSSELKKLLEHVDNYYGVTWKDDERKPFRMHHLTMESMLTTLNKILMTSHEPKIKKAYEDFMHMHKECSHDLVFDRLRRDIGQRNDRKKIFKTLSDVAPSAS